MYWILLYNAGEFYYIYWYFSYPLYIFYSLSLASSVTNVTLSRFSFPDNTSEPYNVTFNCTIHPDSTADHCEVRARADDRVTRVGKYWVQSCADVVQMLHKLQ